jgi:uncharacterized membrane protein YedE/YeeE
MTIDYANFTPWAALIGGLLLGVASAAFMLVNGRILGISGILGGLFRPKANDVAWRVYFLAGLMSSSWVYMLARPLPTVQVDAGWMTVAVAGILVGVGTRYGSGCTSGHGVCGLSRLSPRSLVATLTFMVAGFVTVLVFKHLLAM